MPMYRFGFEFLKVERRKEVTLTLPSCTTRITTKLLPVTPKFNCKPANERLLSLHDVADSGISVLTRYKSMSHNQSRKNGHSVHSLAPMKLSKALSLLTDLRFAITIAIIPTLRDVFRNPTLLIRPQALSRVFMAHLWVVYGDGSDSRSRDVKHHLINPNAYGSVLDIGAGWFFPSSFKILSPFLLMGKEI